MLGCGLSVDEGCGLYLWVEVITAGGEYGGCCTYMNEREFHLTPVNSSRVWNEVGRYPYLLAFFTTD